MARSIAEIYASIISEKQNQTALQGYLPGNDDVPTLLANITSGSKVAGWRLFSFIIAFAHFILESMQDLFIIEANEIAARSKVGLLPWYVEQSKLWQNGDPLVYIGNQLGYATIDETKRLVTQASAIESGRIIFLKVAKTQGTGFAPLSASEKSSFEGYWSKKKIPGIELAILSLNPDSLTVNLSVEYQAELDATATRAAINDAIRAYLKALNFDGIFRTIEMVDYIQRIPGVRDVLVNGVQFVVGSAGFSVAQKYTTRAGYAVYNANSSTINLIAV